MIKEALDKVAELVKASVKPELVSTGDPGKLVYLTPAGTVEIDKPYPSRKHKADDLDSLVRLANRFADEQTEPVIWVSDDLVALVIDDLEARDEIVCLGLVTTDVFDRIEKLGHGEWLDQKAFIRLLRLEIPFALPPGLLLDRVRRVKFENSSLVSAEKTRNRESLGRELTSRIDTGDELPDEVTLEASVFRLGESFGIACGVDVDPARGLFQLLPLPDEIARVKELAISQIVDVIKESLSKGVEVYRGRP